MKTDRIVASGSGPGGRRRRVHLSLRSSDDLAAICGAEVMYGWTRNVPVGLKPCPRCEAKAAKL